METIIGPAILGGCLVVLSVPLLIGYYLGDRKNPSWLRLGIMMAGGGVFVVACGLIAYVIF